MKLENIKGNTFYIKGGTNTGVYIFKNTEVMIIDPGLLGSRPRKLKETVESNKMKLKYIINTHEHNDHYGGSYYFKKVDKNICNISSKDAKVYIENEDLFYNYILGGKNNEIMKKISRMETYNNVYIDKTVSEGSMYINDTNINVIRLTGHTIGSIGIITPDKVLFVGDALISEDILKKYDFLFLADVEEQLNTLKKLRSLDYEYLVLGHGKCVITKEQSLELIDKNKDSIYKYINQVREYLINPITIETLLKNILNYNNLSYNYKEYHFFKSSLISLISYLINLGEVEYKLENGDLFYYTKVR